MVYRGGYRSRGGGGLIFILYLVLGIYCANGALKFFPVPAFITSIQPWILLVVGALLVVGGINHLRISRRYS